MICLYEYFVLCGTILLSVYWSQTTDNNIDEFDSFDNTWKKGAFAKIIMTYKNKVLSWENAVASEDFFHSFLWRTLKKPQDMTPKAFKACFDIIMKLEDLEAAFEKTNGKRERKLIFCNAFSAEHWNEIIAQQKSMQSCPLTILLTIFKYFMPKKPLDENRNAVRTRRDKTARKLTEKRMLPTNATLPASMKLLDLMTLHANNPFKKPICVVCQEDGYDIALSFCEHHNFHQPDYRKPSGPPSCPHAQSDCDHDDKHRQDKIFVALVPEAVPVIDKDWDHNLAPWNWKEQKYHAADCDCWRSCSFSCSTSCKCNFQGYTDDGYATHLHPQESGQIEWPLSPQDMVNQIILNLVQPDHNQVSTKSPWQNIPVIPPRLKCLKMTKVCQVLPKIR